jgi:hypothetical protein
MKKKKKKKKKKKERTGIEHLYTEIRLRPEADPALPSQGECHARGTLSQRL